MKTNDYIEFFEELDDEDALDAFLQFDAQRPRHPKGRISKKLEVEEHTFIRAQDDSRQNLKFIGLPGRILRASMDIRCAVQS